MPQWTGIVNSICFGENTHSDPIDYPKAELGITSVRYSPPPPSGGSCVTDSAKFQDRFYLDFDCDQARTMFLLKYSEIMSKLRAKDVN